jgi:hypothetical protein
VAEGQKTQANRAASPHALTMKLAAPGGDEVQLSRFCEALHAGAMEARISQLRLEVGALSYTIPAHLVSRRIIEEHLVSQ